MTESLPPHVHAEIQAVLKQAAYRILGMHKHLAELRTHPRQTRSTMEDEALVLDTKYRRYTITREEDQRLAELTSTWPGWRSQS